MAARIRKGDTVAVLKGRDRGKTGEVIEAGKERFLVRGINMVKKHSKPTRDKDGGIISKEAKIHGSNLALVDPEDKKPVRIGFKIEKDGKKRYAKRSGKFIDG